MHVLKYVVLVEFLLHMMFLKTFYLGPTLLTVFLNLIYVSTIPPPAYLFLFNRMTSLSLTKVPSSTRTVIEWGVAIVGRDTREFTFLDRAQGLHARCTALTFT